MNKQEAIRKLREEAYRAKPDQKFKVLRMEPQDTWGVACCFFTQFGESYPFDVNYIPERLIEENRRGNLHSVVARAENGDIIGFLDGYGRAIGVAYAGAFLTLSTVGEIGVRVAAGSAFDRMDKTRLAAWTLAGLCLAYAVLAHVPGKWVFFALGLLFGLGWGVAMPVFNGLMFDVSKPRFRAFNINLGLQMFQAGFFLGPIVGAPVLARWGYGDLYHLCAGISLLAAALMFAKGAGGNERRSENGA